jgi:MFS family permease
MVPQITTFRLSIVTFFLFFGFGATGPVMSLYLQDRLHFTGTQTGLILSMSAFSALVSPVVCSVLADRLISAERLDRLISAERLFGVLLLLGGALMGALYRTESFPVFLVLYLCYYLAVGATASLANVVIFHRIEDRRHYGYVRVWGTFGWIAVAWVFGWLWLRGSGGNPIPERLPDALLLCALSLGGLGLYAFTLPSTVVLNRDARPEFLPRAAFEVVRRPAVLWLALITMAAGVTDRIYYYSAAIFLKQSGVSEPNVLPLLSTGQIPEVFAMILLGRLTTRLGLVPVILLGALCNIARYAFFILANGSRAALTAGILMHGLTYAFFFSTVFILLDSMTEQGSRAGVHQLFTLLSSGVASLLGNWLAGAAMDACRLPDGTVRFDLLWSIPFVIAIAVSLALVWGLRRMRLDPATSTE